MGTVPARRAGGSLRTVGVRGGWFRTRLSLPAGTAVANRKSSDRPPLLLRAVGVPHFDGAVVADRQDVPPVGREGHAAHPGGVAAEPAEGLARGRVPDRDGLVLTAGDQPGAVGAEGDAVDQPAA